ncbi:MAG: type II toxin-antitoxin system HicB family antitoxin [Turicibacter sp.]|nr:type II toxin-antitoxin system HicB family antitoxin [Turicibacter sp.]
MKYVFPAIVRLQEDVGGYHVFFPDIKGAGTVGANLVDSLEMGEDWLCSRLFEMEKEGENIPFPTDMNDIKHNLGDIVTLISTNTDFYRHYYENKSVKKTLTIPMWLNKEAERANVNFSQILQEGLKQHLSVN